MDYLRLLFWLKWTLMLRGYRRSPMSAIGVVLAILFFLPVAVGIAVVSGIGFRVLDPPWNEHLLRAVLLGIYLFWLLGPLLGYALSDAYDVTKLLVYPLSARQVFTGAILGSFVDFPVLLLLPTLAAVLLGFSSGVFAGILVFLTVALFLFHTLSLSQAVILASAGVLRSRRFRDILVVVLPLFWMSYYVVTRMLGEQIARLNWLRFLQSPVWEAINLLPSGLAARAVGAAGRGEYLPSLGFLALLFLCAAGTIYLAGWLIEKVYAGEVISPAVRKRAAEPAAPKVRAQEQTATSAPGGAFGLRLPPVIEAVMDKEVKYLFRDPYFKLRLMNLVYMLFIVGFAFFRRGTSGFGARGAGIAWAGSGWVLLSEMSMVFNIFGTDGGAATLLFLFPSSRRQILIGKNLTLFTALSVVNLAFVLVLAFLAGVPHMFGALFCWMELALAVCISTGNLMSIWFPHRVVARGWRMQQQSASGGCGYAFLTLGGSLATMALMLPVLAALVAPAFWISPAWYALSVPVMVAYVAGLYLLSLRLAEPLLIRREIEVVGKVGAEE